MRYKLIDESHGSRTFMVVFDKGDAAMKKLLEFVTAQEITAASFVGLGAFSEARLAFYDRTTKEYTPIPVDEQTEVLNITGNVALYNGEPRLHAHATLSRPDSSTIGGHLVEGIVWPTLEITLVASPDQLERDLDEETGLPLLRP